MNRLATTGNITWDGRLEDFKGSDTTHYVRTAVDLARTCGECRSELTPGGPVSLVVEIIQSTAPDGSEFLTFTDFVCHRGCSDPAVVVRQTPWEPNEMSPIAVRAVFTQKSSAGPTRAVPVLAYTLLGHPATGTTNGDQLHVHPDAGGSAPLLERRRSPLPRTAQPPGRR
jgi:hypothetical protein